MEGAMNRRRRGVTVGGAALAAVLVPASVAWACTTNPFSGVNPKLEALFDDVHCGVVHPDDPACPGPNEAAVTFVAHGSGTLYNGKVVDVWQDDDDSDPTPGRFMSALGGCDGGDPVRGTLTYGRQTVGNFRVGTGSGVLVATDGPGLYGICAGPAQDLSAIGEFVFM